MTLPVGQQLQAQRLLSGGSSWVGVAAHIGVTVEKLRGALDSEWREKRSRAVKLRRLGAARPVLLTKEGFLHAERIRPINVHPEVLAERDARLACDPRSLSAFRFGDPLPGYSALDKAMSRKPLFERLKA